MYYEEGYGDEREGIAEAGIGKGGVEEKKSAAQGQSDFGSMKIAEQVAERVAKV